MKNFKKTVDKTKNTLYNNKVAERQRYAFVAQLVEQRTENPRVVGSIPTEGTICGFSSSGRARPCQGRGSEFEPRNPLQILSPIYMWGLKYMAT